MKSLRTSFIFAFCFIAAPALVWAASFVMPSDAELIDSAEAIVIATAGVSLSQENSLVRIVTVTDFTVERVLKGAGLGSTIQLTGLGGRIADQFVLVPGTPRFRESERVLLFLEQTPRGEWRVLDMVLGKFNFARDEHGESLVVRSLHDASIFTRDGSEHRERARSETKFLNFIAARLRGEAPAEDYFLDSEPSDSRTIAPMSHRTPFLLSIPGVGAFRWQNPTASFTRCEAAACPTPSGLNGISAITNGMGLWNAAGAGVNYSLSGTTTNTAPTTTAAGGSDGNNNIVYNDPHDLVSGTFGSGSNTLGIGIVYGDFTYTLPGDSEVFINIPEGDVVMNNGISSGNIMQAVLDAAMAHELGHTLGLQHSDEAPAPHTTTQAVMNSFVFTGCGGLCTYDLNAITTVYGSGGPSPCTPPSITSQPLSQTITSGNSATLSVGATGTGTLSYQWHQGTSGTINPIAGAIFATYNTGSLADTTSYWVLVTGECDPPANSQTATVTVTAAPPCTPPSIFSQPQPQTVQSGSNVILSVGATGTGPLSYQWYRGNTGDTSSPVIGATFDTVSIGPMSLNTTFWVQITGPCAPPANSVSVTVTVTTGCTAISITQQPTSRQINAGSSTTLSVGVTGTSPSFQWFQGTPPGGTPVGTNSPNLTVSPSVTTSFYVQVSNACSGPINSVAATVTVCPAGTLCLTNGRFQVTLLARNPGNNATDTGLALQENQTFGFFALTALTGDPNNLEVFVKIVGPLPDGTFIVFFGGLTGFEYTITVRDMTTGLTDVYIKPANQSRNGFAIFRGARSAEEDCPIGFTGTPQPSQGGTCVPGDLCLLNSRFRVRLSARNHRNNQTAPGVAFPKTPQFGYFALPGLTGDLTNPEVFVKVLGPVPRPGLPDQFWVFFAGLTDFEYTLTVTDLTNGQTKTFFKPAEKLCGGADTAAFPF